MRCVLESGEQKLLFLSRLLCLHTRFSCMSRRTAGKGDEKAVSPLKPNVSTTFYPKPLQMIWRGGVDRGPDKQQSIQATITEAAIMRECRTVRLAFINYFPRVAKKTSFPSRIKGDSGDDSLCFSQKKKKTIHPLIVGGGGAGRKVDWARIIIYSYIPMVSTIQSIWECIADKQSEYTPIKDICH